MLFRAQYFAWPRQFIGREAYFDEIDIHPPSSDFRMKITTKAERDEIDEVYSVISIGSSLRMDPPLQVAEIFADPERFRKNNEELHPGSRPDDPFGTFVRFPDDYWEFLRDVCRAIDSKTEHLFGVVCWKLGVRGGPDRFETDLNRLYCHGEKELSRIDPLEHSDWKHLPHGMRIGFGEDPVSVRASEEDGVTIGSLFAQSALPLGHELLQEAWRLSESSPRSALVIAYAAAETRAKELIVKLAPSTEWLVKNAPSPPLDHIVKNYFQELRPRFKAQQADGLPPIPPKEIRSALKGAMEARNRLVHGKGREVDLGKLGVWLRRIDDFVSLCDYYEGHRWALDRLSEDVRKQVE